MSPLFRRVGNALGLSLHKAPVSKKEEEESSNILELSDPTSKSRKDKGQGNARKITARTMFLGTTASHSAKDGERWGDREELPDGRIVVNLDLEQDVHTFEGGSSSVSRGSGTPL